MDMVMMVEIIVGIVVLAGAVRFAVRDARQRRPASVQDQSEPEHIPEVQERDSEREADQHPSEVADQA